MFDLICFAAATWIVRKMIASNKPVLLKLSDRKVSAREVALCHTCVCSLIRKNGNGQEFTSCTYGGNLNPVGFVVLECSGYGDKYVEYPEKVAGFVKPNRGGRNNVTVIRIASEADVNQVTI